MRYLNGKLLDAQGRLLGEVQSVRVAMVRELLADAPYGTNAPAMNGGRWYKMNEGWKWNGPAGNGGIFPRPGGDWNGTLIYPDTRAMRNDT